MRLSHAGKTQDQTLLFSGLYRSLSACFYWLLGVTTILTQGGVLAKM